jgi:hypothetical protein
MNVSIFWSYYSLQYKLIIDCFIKYISIKILITYIYINITK